MKLDRWERRFLAIQMIMVLAGIILWGFLREVFEAFTADLFVFAFCVTCELFLYGWGIHHYDNNSGG
jgi:hypothetical protein